MLARYPAASMSPAIVVFVLLSKDTEHAAPVQESLPFKVKSRCTRAVTFTAALAALEDIRPDTSTLARKLDNTIVLPVPTRSPVLLTLRFSPALTDSVREVVSPSSTTSPSTLISMLHAVHVSAQSPFIVNADCVEFSAVTFTGHALSEL
jgi:hypothetical protein